MTLLLLLLCFQQKFYNYYESGIKNLESKDLPLAIADLEKAISLRPEPSATAKTYGVQVKPYVPYSYLAWAYWLAADAPKSRKALTLALSKGEKEMGGDLNTQRLDMVESGLKQVERLARPSSPEQPKPKPDLAPAVDAALKGDLIIVRDYLEVLLLSFPDDARLKSLYEATLQQILDRRSQLDSQQKRQATIEGKLKTARRNESDGQLDAALKLYAWVANYDTSNAEANEAMVRIRKALAAKGRAESEIQKVVVDQKDELLREAQEQLALSEAKTQELRAAFEKQLKELVDPLTVNFGLVADPRRYLTVNLSLSLRSTVPLARASLYLNSKRIKEWQIHGKTEFAPPRLLNLQFDEGDNTVLLQAWDMDGHILTSSYPYNYPKAPPRLQFTKKDMLFLVIALFALGALAFFIKQQRRRRAFRERFNPYVAGAPILSDRMFYGRSGLLKQILNALHNNSLMVFGERRIGKTSFLHRLHSTLPAVDDTTYTFIPVFIDLQGVREQDFFSALIHEIAQVLAERGIESLPVEEEFGVRQFTSHLRKYIGALKEQCTKKPKLVLLLDEVDVMNSFSEQTNQQLRSVFMKGFAEHLAAVMAGIHINTKWKSEGSPWYNFFEQIELKPFAKEQAEELIMEPVNGIYSYTQDAVDRIMALSDGKPYLIQKMCLNLISYILLTNKRKITAKDVDLVFKDIEKEFYGAINE